MELEGQTRWERPSVFRHRRLLLSQHFRDASRGQYTEKFHCLFLKMEDAALICIIYIFCVRFKVKYIFDLAEKRLKKGSPCASKELDNCDLSVFFIIRPHLPRSQLQIWLSGGRQVGLVAGVDPPTSWTCKLTSEGDAPSQISVALQRKSLSGNIVQY